MTTQSWRITPKNHEYSLSDCSICRGSTENPDITMVDHNINDKGTYVFHRSCLKEWVLKGHNSCPLCRESIESGELFGKSSWLKKINDSALARIGLETLSAAATLGLSYAYSGGLSWYGSAIAALTAPILASYQYFKIITTIPGAMTFASSLVATGIITEKLLQGDFLLNDVISSAGGLVAATQLLSLGVDQLSGLLLQRILRS